MAHDTVGWKIGLLGGVARVLKGECDGRRGRNRWMFLSRVSLHFVDFPVVHCPRQWELCDNGEGGEGHDA